VTREWLGWFVAGIVAVLVCTLGAMQREGQVGRYQLVEGRYTVVTPRNTIEATSVWRIDTTTGDVVMFQSRVDGENTTSGWMGVGAFAR
jgi:hypothetical protein